MDGSAGGSESDHVQATESEQVAGWMQAVNAPRPVPVGVQCKFRDLGHYEAGIGPLPLARVRAGRTIRRIVPARVGREPEQAPRLGDFFLGQLVVGWEGICPSSHPAEAILPLPHTAASRIAQYVRRDA